MTIWLRRSSHWFRSLKTLIPVCGFSLRKNSRKSKLNLIRYSRSCLAADAVRLNLWRVKIFLKQALWLFHSRREKITEYDATFRWRKSTDGNFTAVCHSEFKTVTVLSAWWNWSRTDDSNVGRYANYLHKLTKHTQFIVITHRRGTMAAADRLYGITMQEKGVSALVSVDLIADDLEKENRLHKSKNKE